MPALDPTPLQQPGALHGRLRMITHPEAHRYDPSYDLLLPEMHPDRNPKPAAWLMGSWEERPTAALLAVRCLNYLVTTPGLLVRKPDEHIWHDAVSALLGLERRTWPLPVFRGKRQVGRAVMARECCVRATPRSAAVRRHGKYLRFQLGVGCWVDLHRLLCWVANGPAHLTLKDARDAAPRSIVVMHDDSKCACTSCLRPGHLRWGKRKDNSASYHRALQTLGRGHTNRTEFKGERMM